MTSEPVLYNLPVGPEQAALAADVLDHLRRCAPLRVTPEMARYPQAWRVRILRFDTRPDPEGGP